MTAETYGGAGIYLLSGLSPSSLALPVYYGSSENVGRRLREHFADLGGNRHGNALLQRYWNKNGVGCLKATLVEATTPQETLTREQHYLDTLLPFAALGRGFNIAKDATAPMQGRKHTEETKRKVSANNARFWKGKPRSQATKDSISKAKKGRKQPASFYDKTCKTYTLRNPQGETIQVTNLREFARSNGLDNAGLYRVVNGKRASYRGYRKA